MESWEAIAAASQKAVLDSIPDKWRVAAPDKSVTNVIDFPRTCGLLSPTQLSITEQTATALAGQLRTGELKSVDVTEAFCARAAIAHQCVNCLTDYFYAEALERAKELDDILAKTGKPVGPLHGLPIAVKDHFAVKGKKTTMGYTAWHSEIRDTDASIIQVLRLAGAIPFARTTMPQTGMMLQTVSNLWGRTLNPFNRGFSAGGSSGGDGTLIAMHGSPFCPSTDIGGSIRAPSAFNGLYGIKPTAERIPKSGLLSPAYGQISVKISCGPNCHSVDDLSLVTKLLLTHYDYIGFEPSCTPFPWKEDVELPKKLCFGTICNDGVVTPQPPIRRSMDETVQKLEAAGHSAVAFDLPFDLWEAAQVLWKLYFQTGGKESKAVVASSGEPLTGNFSWYLDTFDIKPLTVPELFALNTKHAMYKRQFADAWAASKAKTGTGQPFDAVICPCAASAGFPHEFPVWWGYFTLWNMLDYPCTILPLKTFKIDPAKDPKDTAYTPNTISPFDRMNWEIYDPELWKSQPVCIQIVTPQFHDEELLAVTEVVDKVCNA